jgi:hypothetical protein
VASVPSFSAFPQVVLRRLSSRCGFLSETAASELKERDMTTIIIANSITAGVVIFGLAAVIHLGHLTAGGLFERTLRRLDVHYDIAAEQRTPERRAA